jgi:hypothetical protein
MKLLKKIFKKSESEITFKLEKISLSEGDVVIIKVPMVDGKTFEQYAKKIHSIIKKEAPFGNNKVLIVREDLSLIKIDSEVLINALRQLSNGKTQQ